MLTKDELRAEIERLQGALEQSAGEVKRLRVEIERLKAPKEVIGFRAKGTGYVPILKDDFLDVTAPEIVEIVVRDDQKVLWINIDGKCALRACRIENLVLPHSTLCRPGNPPEDGYE